MKASESSERYVGRYASAATTQYALPKTSPAPTPTAAGSLVAAAKQRSAKI